MKSDQSSCLQPSPSSTTANLLLLDMPSRGGKSNSRKTVKSPKSPNSKETKNDKSKNDKPAPSATVTDLLKKAALQKSSSFLTNDGTSVSVSVKSKNPNIESQDASLSTSPKPNADEEASQTPEVLPKETNETPDPAIDDEESTQGIEE